jgi:hypothetical protein
MAHPFDPASPSRRDCLQLLIAPCGSLSADGQLRELIRERRRHAALGEGGEDGGGLWFLPEGLCRQQLGLEGMEGLVTQASRTAIWLQLRFGGQLQTINLPSDWLCAKAMALPPSAPEAPVGAAAAGRAV